MIDYKNLPLWNHQLHAIADGERYLKDPNFLKNLLIKMPTGSGKTGIMAILSRIIFADKNFLVVVPSVVLREQLIAQLSKDFWEDNRKMNIKAATLPPKEVIELLPKNMEDIRNNYDPNIRYIYICVVNTLHTLKKNPADYKFFKDCIEYIFFDEGHKEPAFSWAKAVRDLGKKTILFSATPYRNDLKLFNINKEHGKYHFLTHKEAVKRNLVRDIEFRSVSGSSGKLRELFDKLLPRLKKDCKELSDGNITAKIIVRCSSEERVKNTVSILKTKNQNVLGLHENFAKEEFRRKKVPREQDINRFDIVVHQNKLIEGVDNPNFLVLVLLDDFDNERSLIQQLGRITRNLDQKKSRKAIVYYWATSVKNPLEEVWQKFVSFDHALKNVGLYDVFDLIKVNPDIKLIYLKNAIRSVKDISEIGIDEIKIPKRTTIREITKAGEVTADILFERVTDELSKNDASIELSYPLDNSGYFIVYHGVFTSPYFETTAVLDSKYEIIVFYIFGHYVFFLDTTGKLPEYLLLITKPLDPNRLLNMTSKSRRFSNISLINSDLGKHSLRRRTFSAFSLKDVAPLLNDHNYIASTVSSITKGFIDDQFLQRYIGIKTGKVSEYVDEYCYIGEYRKWIAAITNFLKRPLEISNYYNRYAKKIPQPKDCTPVNILLEIQADDNSEFSFNASFAYEWLDVASEIDVNGFFEMSIQPKTGDKKVLTYSVEISFDYDANKYVLKSDEVDENFYSVENDQTLISYLNQYQSFRIVTKDNSAFYVFGSFYEPRLNLRNRQNDLDLMEILIPIQDLKVVKSEKGNNKALKPSNNLWHKDTLFGLIARMGNGYKDQKLIQEHFNFTHLVCDDLGNEIADFIGLDIVNKRVVVIHAKGKQSKLSASNFQDVCGQATKKLDILSPFFEKKPELNIGRFDKTWKMSNVGIVNKRIIEGNVNGKQFWDLFEEMVRSPQTKKEVYLVTGAMLDKNFLEQQLGLPDIKQVRPETIDLIYLLRSTWSAVSSLGATLKVFCY